MLFGSAPHEGPWIEDDEEIQAAHDAWTEAADARTRAYWRELAKHLPAHMAVQADVDRWWMSPDASSDDLHRLRAQQRPHMDAIQAAWRAYTEDMDDLSRRHHVPTPADLSHAFSPAESHGRSRWKARVIRGYRRWPDPAAATADIEVGAWILTQV